MSSIQKQAVFNVAVIGSAMVLFLAAIPFVGVMRAYGTLGLMGFLGFSVLFHRKRRGDRSEVAYDERDWDIQRRAHQMAFGVFWVMFVAACMGTWWIRGDSGTIPVRVLPFAVVVAWGVWQMTESVAVLVQYHRQN